MTRDEALDILRRNAIHDIGHEYAGSCPDPTEGFDVRDPECEVCHALVALDPTQPVRVWDEATETTAEIVPADWMTEVSA